MPAYRSSAEAEIRQSVVARLRAIRPEARIIHEINVCAFGNRIDVLAVSRAEIIAVEIKSERDKLDRLAAQLAAMKRCAHVSVAAIHEKFLVKKDGYRTPCLPEPLGWSDPAWVFPETKRFELVASYDPYFPWASPPAAPCSPLPSGALDMLWRDELLEMCGKFSVCVPKRPTMGVMVPALRWGLTGRQLTLGICAALRARRCVEADAEIEWSEAA